MLQANGPFFIAIVEDHCDALEYWHLAVRKKHLPAEGILMLHFDAHPDLMVPQDMNADVCFDPRALYEALRDSEAGIAEWILPAVFEGHLNRVWWIRPPWAKQFTDGKYSIGVGQQRSTGCLRVDSQAPYFVDDHLYCSREVMDDVRDVQLYVSLIPNTPEVCTEMVAGIGVSPSTWGLDICLDYFVTGNPFIEDLKKVLGCEATQLVKDVYMLPMFRAANTTLSHDMQMKAEAVFTTTVKRMIGAAVARQCRPPEAHALDFIDADTSDQETLARLYEPDIGGDLSRKFLALLRTLSIEALELIEWAEHCVGLPQHATSREDIVLMIHEMETMLKSINNPPSIITVARSTEDGYTPIVDSEWLQDELLAMLRRVYGDVPVQKTYLQVDDDCSS